MLLWLLLLLAGGVHPAVGFLPFWLMLDAAVHLFLSLQCWLLLAAWLLLLWLLMLLLAVGVHRAVGLQIVSAPLIVVLLVAAVVAAGWCCGCGC